MNLDRVDHVIALAGNPNTGKSTVFNALTGLRQHTGNWPGKTVTRAEGAFEYSGKRYKLVDLPGTYSLLSTSLDEEIARDFILFGQPDVTVVVADASRLERNLNLVLQVLEITDRAVLCLNLVDEAQRHGSRWMNGSCRATWVCPWCRRRRARGKACRNCSRPSPTWRAGKFVCRPHRLAQEPPALRGAVNELRRHDQDFVSRPAERPVGGAAVVGRG